MAHWLNGLSLRWKFMLAPVIGIAMMIALAVFMLNLRRDQDAFISHLQNVEFARAQLVANLSTRMADNHAQIYELLRLAEEQTDEGEFYDAGKPRLNEIHRIEAEFEDEIESGHLSPNEAQMFSNLLRNITDYRITITNALLTATVDMRLARDLMTTSSEQYNRLNGEFLAVNQALQQRLNEQLTARNVVADRQTLIISVVFLAIIVVMLLLSGILSNVLSRDLRVSIGRLGGLLLRERHTGGSSKEPGNEVAMLAAAIEGVRASHEDLRQTQAELDATNQRLSQSYVTILTRERTLAELNDQLKQKIEQLNTTIAERDLAEEALRRAQRLEAVGQLTGGIAHDFNNLMTAMIGHAELLESFSAADARTRHSVDAIVKAVDRGVAMTQRLLAFARKQPLSPQPTEVRGLLLGIEELLRRSLRETIDLRLEPGSTDSVAFVDAHQFENAIINLAVNARDAMPRGGILEITAAEIALDGTRSGELDGLPAGTYVRVRVRDNGTGMSAEVLAKAFEPFFTTKDVGEGSGLGLSMVYGFAKQSSGHVTIMSRPGEGTAVNLYVPKSHEAAKPGEDRPPVIELRRGSGQILVVEDDEDIREVTAAILRGQGYAVTEASSSAEAVQLLASGKTFSLLFTDLVLPGGMNGVEVAEEALRLQPGIKILFTSGYASKGIIRSARAGINENLIRKPYRRADLLQKIQSVLGRAGKGR